MNGFVGNTEALANMQSSKKKNKYSNFANRMNSSGANNEKYYSTLEQVIHDVKSGEIVSIQIDTTTMQNCYTAKTTMDLSDMKYPKLGHFWAYIKRSYSEDQRFNGYLNATHIYPFQTYDMITFCL